VHQIAAAHRSVQNSSQYRCYVFWTTNETSQPTDFLCKSNWVDTGNTLGTQSTLVHRLGIASRAFNYNGSVYFWGVFAGTSSIGYRSAGTQLQNSYFLYRDDGFLVAKATYQRAGGFAYSIGCLPNVQLTSGSTVFSWCGTERRIVPVGQSGYGYSDRGPRDITFTFDSNAARRTRASVARSTSPAARSFSTTASSSSRSASTSSRGRSSSAAQPAPSTTARTRQAHVPMGQQRRRARSIDDGDDGRVDRLGWSCRP
jgi:hypothetical protein